MIYWGDKGHQITMKSFPGSKNANFLNLFNKTMSQLPNSNDVYVKFI